MPTPGVARFVHPVTGKDMYFDSPLPNDMTQLLEKWRAKVNG